LYIYRLNKDNRIIEIIENVLKIEKDNIYTIEGSIISGILGNVIATPLEYNLGDLIDDDVKNEIENLKTVTDTESIATLIKSLATLNVENQKKETMINMLTKTLSELNIEIKKKEVIVEKLVRNIEELNIKMNK